MQIYQIDAFAKDFFQGNPAAVVPLQEWLPDDLMQRIAMENNLAETAFFVPEGENYVIRWFTPTVEVALCGPNFGGAASPRSFSFLTFASLGYSSLGAGTFRTPGL